MAGKNLTGQANTADYNLGRGKVYFAGIDPSTGLPDASGYRFLGNAPEFNISVEVETLEHQSSQEGLKTVDKEVVISQKVNLALTLDELNFENVALFFSGETGTHTNAAKSTQDAEILTTSAVLGRWYDLADNDGNRLYDIDDTKLTVEEDPLGTPTPLVKDTDFTLDAKMGRIFLLTTATNVAGGDTVGFDYTADATAKDVDEVKALTQTNVAGALKFVSENPSDGDHQSEYQFHQVSLKADGDFSLIGDEFTTMGLTGVAERNVLADPDSPTLTIRTHADA
ncbi:MAG: hypothetical protein ACF8XB_07390 [Planctomycetota bacterium JB042]